VKLQSYTQISMVFRSSVNLDPKFFGPFLIVDRIGPIAYKLELSAQS